MCHCGRCFFNFDDDGYGGYGYGSDYSSDYGGEEDYYDMMMEHYLGVFGGRKAGKGNAREKSDAALLREHTARDRFKELADATPANCSGAPQKFELLPPAFHLTNPCWRDFRNHVALREGWTATRRLATPDAATPPNANDSSANATAPPASQGASSKAPKKG
ncbi:hypothetical protein T484DRAFT_1899434, partial [Baffinella frigidus]